MMIQNGLKNWFRYIYLSCWKMVLLFYFQVWFLSLFLSFCRLKYSYSFPIHFCSNYTLHFYQCKRYIGGRFHHIFSWIVSNKDSLDKTRWYHWIKSRQTSQTSIWLKRNTELVPPINPSNKKPSVAIITSLIIISIYQNGIIVSNTKEN